MRSTCIVALLPAFLGCLIAGCSNPEEPKDFESLKKDAGNLVTSLQGEVASFRGKSFLRNVSVAVYTRDQYAAIVSSQPTVPAAQRDRYNRVLKCEGLLHENEDYFEGYDSMLINKAGGFYRTGSDTIFIVVENGAVELSGDDSFAVFHELVHAMQDQYYDLQKLEDSVKSSDQYYALMYTFEGEAELLAMYYSYKLYFGYYPSSSYPIMDVFDLLEGDANQVLDSLHGAGEPLMIHQPPYWAYFSYGPKFIDSVAGMNWSAIDNVIFASLPLKTSEVMHPWMYLNKNEHVLNINGFIDGLDTTKVLYDVDELGEMLTCVLFREWDFSAYASIASALLTDKMIVFTDSSNDSLRLIWYTLWRDSLSGRNFMTNYSQIIARKRGIVQPVPVQVDTMVVYSDTVNRIYAEQTGNRLFVMENYQPGNRDALIQQLRSISNSIAAAKRAAVPGRRYPYVKKLSDRERKPRW